MSHAVVDLTTEDEDSPQSHKSEEKIRGTPPGQAAVDELAAVEAELAEVEAEVGRLLRHQQGLQARRERLQQAVDLEKRAPKADWTGSFAWDERADAVLKTVFGLQAFRPQQRDVINATMQGRDVLCLMPSGGGKSLCYQLPALLESARGYGCTLVISPLLSLIQDQVLGLLERGVRVTSLTSLTSKTDQAEIYKQITEDTELKVLYATPERVVNVKRFMGKLEKLYKSKRLMRIAIDEAHCCSQWGNDFRPDYKKLGILRQQFPDVPILALTATATKRVRRVKLVLGSRNLELSDCPRRDLMDILRIPGCEVFESSINRPNLFYEVRWKPAAAEGVIEDIVRWISERFPGGESGIVYCLTRKDTESVAQQLAAKGLATAHYHADMDPATRQQVHLLWSQGKLRIIVATIAFGMGINKPDVRFVIHHSLSKSIENYYQESGRAGRDGLPARCLLYYRPSDALRQAALVVTEPGWDSHLFGIMRYAENADKCRRVIVSRHFAEAPPACQQTCDICSSGGERTEERDITPEARAVLSVLSRAVKSEHRLTLLQLINSWRNDKVTGEQELAKAGTKDDNERIIGHLLVVGILQLDFGFTAYATTAYLKASAQGMQGRERVVMVSRESEAADPSEAPPKKRARGG